MKIVDHAGNSLKPGRLLWWKPQSMYVKVKDVVAPTKDTPGKVTVDLTFGIEPIGKQSGEVVQFKDFVTVYDPEDELKAEVVLAKATEADGNVRTMSAR